MRVEGQFTVNAEPPIVFRCITDPRLMAECVPGCESIEAVSPTSYRARVLVAVGGIEARFNVVVDITTIEPPHRVLSKTRGEEGSRSSMLAADNTVTLYAVATGTEVHYASDVSITGRLGKFALGMMKKKVEATGAEFANRFQAAIETELARAAAAAPTTALIAASIDNHAAPLT